MQEIQQELGLKKSSINSYLPYSKVPYKEEEISTNAERCELYRKRKAAVEDIHDIASLWECLDVFEGYTFYTENGQKFNYEVKKEKDGTDARSLFIKSEEIIIDGSIIKKAYESFVAVGDFENGKKELNEFKGLSYIISIFARFRIIDEKEDFFK